jgi:hypothetical protein
MKDLNQKSGNQQFLRLNAKFSPLSIGLFSTLLGVIGVLPAPAEEVKNAPSADISDRLYSQNQISENAIAPQITEAITQSDSTAISETEPTAVEVPVSEDPEASSLEIDEVEPLADEAQSDRPIDILPAPQSEEATPELSQTLAPQGIRILSPQSGIAGTRSTNLVVQYGADTQIEVSVNQNPIDPETPTQIERDETQNLITQGWYNIPLEAGKNTLTVQGSNGTSASVELDVEDTAIRLNVAPVGNPRVVADGRSIITIAGQLTDENGQAIAEDVEVTLTASAGEFVDADQDEDQPGFQTLARQGQFSARLQSTLDAQKVRIRAAVEEQEVEIQESLVPAPSTLEAYTQVEFITNLRPSLVSGVVNLRIGQSGTDFWGSRREFLNPDLIDDGTEVDLEGAVFATGRIGEWLFTGAYNSERPLNETCDGITRLFRGPQFCEQQYPVYGDSSNVDYLTPSKDSVYLRFERTSPVPGAEPDYVMWGDYNTQELTRASQLFSATTRALHGFKGNYNFGNLQLTAFYSPDVQGFQRDTIVPNGTSGYYFLSRRLLVEGSENIFIETEELNRPGTVIERRPLRRGPDYEIDYDRGTLLFRRPIQATKFNFFGTDVIEPRENVPEGAVGATTLVQRIVVTYQHEGIEGDDTDIYGGRLQYNFSQEFGLESWIGATYLQEDQGTQDFELYGADFLVPLGRNGQFIGEYAHSTHNSPFLGNVSGSAYRFELYGSILGNLNGRAYYRSVEEGFANNATFSFTPGQTRYGAAIAAQVTSTTSLQVGYDHEENFGIAPAVRTDFFDLFNPVPVPLPGTRVDNELTTIRAGIQQQIGNASLGVDYVNRSREDRVSNLFQGDASQLVSRLGIPITPSLAFRAQNELNLGSSDPLYPDRTTFGLDWAVHPGVTLRLAHQFFDGGLFDDNSITSLDTLVEHRFSENTVVTGRYSVISGFGRVTGQGAIGLNHGWVIAPGLRLNLGYEHIFNDIFTPTAAGERFPQPYAVGQTAASLGLFGGDTYSVGLEYTESPDFKASARFEHRTGSGNNNTVISAAAAGKLSPALTALASYEQANFSNQLIEGLGDSATLRLGLAYRNPYNDRWNALLRYEYRKNPSTIPETLLIGSGTGSREHLVAGEAIYSPNWRWEFYGKGAFRTSTTFLADNFSNSSSIFLTQLRAAYRLNYRMDLAVEGRWIGQPSENFNEFGVALETGYYLSPDLRLYLGYSFGSVDDRDFTGYRSEGGPYLGITFKVNELFGGFGRQRVSPSQQQESQVQPVAIEAPAANTPNE